MSSADFERRALKEHAFAVSPFTKKTASPAALQSLQSTLKTYKQCVNGFEQRLHRVS
jgi:hypothetical protein